MCMNSTSQVIRHTALYNGYTDSAVCLSNQQLDNTHDGALSR